MRTRSAAIVAAVFGPHGIGRDEALITVGLLLLARGLWLAWPPAAYMVPGAIILWIALPSRTVFLVRSPEPDKAMRRTT